jgi:hypothetical protein
MQRKLYLPLAAMLTLVAACNTDVVTRPNADDGEAVAAKSGTGNPKFARQFTDCDFSSNLITCDYKISGLGNTDVVDVFLTAPVLVEADCQNPGGNVAPGQAFETTVTGSQLQLRPENGQITSTISIRASDAQDPVASQVCPNPQWTVVNVRKTFTGEFDLFAIVHHQDGSETRIESEF